MVTSTGPVLAIVPARGGSKGLPGKNVRPLGGHPLIAYSIASGRAATTIDRLIVSTDDARIAEIARSYGAETPFLRPAELATDATLDLPVMEHALGWLREHEQYEPAIVVQIRPTTPFRPHGLLDEAVRLLQRDVAADSVRAVTHPRQHPSKMWTRDAKGCLQPLWESSEPEPYNLPRQRLPVVFWQTGHVDAMWTETILKKRTLTGDIVKSILVDPAFVVDIDRLEDLHFAEYLLGNRALDIDPPQRSGPPSLPLSPSVRLVVLDFDGTMTDDRVWVDQDGRESVACSRSDGLGLEMLIKAGLALFVLSREKTPVVRARCEKLGIPFQQGVADKLAALQQILAERNVEPRDVVYVGNDLNDLGCMRFVGFSCAPADAHRDVKQQASHVLARPGGRGAVRELCDTLLACWTARKGQDEQER